MRWTTTSSGTSISRAAVSRRSSSSSASPERVGLLDRAREAVEQEAVARVVLAEALERSSPMITSSGTSSPRVHVALGLLARARSRSATAARRMSPVAMCGSPKSSRQARGLRALAGARRAEQDQIELGHGAQRYARAQAASGRGRRAPCRPLSGRSALLEEALVVAHHQLRLELLHRVQRDADHDDDRGAAEVEVHAACGRRRSPAAPRPRRGRARPGRSGGRGSGRGTRRSAARGCTPGDEAAVLLEVVGLVDRVERDRRVEVGEDDDQQRLAEDVVPAARREEVSRADRPAWC